MKISASQLSDLYTDYLIAGVSYATATEMSCLLDGHVSHDRITRLSGSGYLNSKTLWYMSKPICEEIAMDDAVLIFDDSVEAAGKLSFRYVLCDSRFSSAENMKYVDDLDRYFVMAFKDNRKVALSKEDKLSGKYVSIQKAVSEGCVRSVYIEQLEFPILITKQVFKNGDGSTGTLYLACNDLNLTYEQITTIYKKRWKVEEYHKSIKSNTAFPKSPTKTIVAQQSHFIASVMAFIKLERLKVRKGLNHFAIKSLLLKKASLAAWAELYKQVA